jgi:hypothetical protein
MGSDSIYCECGLEAELVGGDKVYPGRYDLAERLFYRCKPCEAWVSCHETTMLPMGSLAGRELRELRRQAHALFDPLWQRKIRRDGCSTRTARGAGYAWLSRETGIPKAKCHIGMMNADECRKVIALCESVYSKVRAAA